jgi:hypothetical protein
VALVLDTGVVLALLDDHDPAHERSVAVVEEVDEDLVLPAPVLVEVDYWLLKRYGHDAWTDFVEDVERGAYRLYHLDETGVARAAEIERSYPALDLGFVDASVVVTCEQLDEKKVATLDRRDFSVVRPNHCEALELLPA